MLRFPENEAAYAEMLVEERLTDRQAYEILLFNQKYNKRVPQCCSPENNNVLSRVFQSLLIHIYLAQQLSDALQIECLIEFDPDMANLITQYSCFQYTGKEKLESSFVYKDDCDELGYDKFVRDCLCNKFYL